MITILYTVVVLYIDYTSLKKKGNRYSLKVVLCSINGLKNVVHVYKQTLLILFPAAHSLHVDQNPGLTPWKQIPGTAT